jgi:hypothetical protein
MSQENILLTEEIEQLIMALGGSRAARAILADYRTKNGTQVPIVRGGTVILVPTFPKTADDLRIELTQAKIKVSNFAHELMGRLVFMQQWNGVSGSIQVQEVCLRDIGLPAPVTLDSIYTAAARYSLVPCRAPIAVLYGIQQKKLSADMVHVAMIPVPDRAGTLQTFTLAQFQEGILLDGGPGDAMHTFDPDSVFLFTSLVPPVVEEEYICTFI